MIAAGEIAVRLELWSRSDAERRNALIKKAGLPTKLPVGLDINQLIDALQLDKKVKSGRVRFVLPTHIGKVLVTDQVPTDIITQVLSSFGC